LEFARCFADPLQFFRRGLQRVCSDSALLVYEVQQPATCCGKPLHLPALPGGSDRCQSWKQPSVNESVLSRNQFDDRGLLAILQAAQHPEDQVSLWVTPP